MKVPKHFYYITHKDNLKSILKHGILSRSKTKNGLLARIFSSKRIKSIHAEDIVQKRKNKKFRNQSLWNYANVYFHVKNPMLYRVIKNYGIENIVVLQINSDILQSNNVGITDGNAASDDTHFFEDVNQGLKALDVKQFKEEYWNESNKRKYMAEVLVCESIPPEKIMGIYVANTTISEQVKKEIFTRNIPIIPNKNMFFLPEYQKRISDYITLAKGDMFFSKMHTFTISVNIVGIMGKGLASRAKYQFPDVYVLYQDICRQKTLKMGVPYLYKREDNFERSLLEDTKTITTENGNRWFLLFPTKNHWKENSPINGIEKGLQWLVSSYKHLEIESIALPALGCGLGALNWKDVGPLMCKYLNQMNIQSCIYLPVEKQTPSNQLEPQFLLHKNDP